MNRKAQAKTEKAVAYRATIRKSLHLVRGSTGLFVWVLIVNILAALLHGVADPLTLTFLIDSLEARDFRMFVIIGLVMVAIYTSFRFLGYFTTLLSKRLKNQTVARLVDRMLGSFFRLPYPRVAGKDSGYHISRVYDEPAKTSQIIDLLIQLFSTGVVGLGGIAVCLYLSWKVSLLLVVVVPILTLMANHFSRKIHRLAKEENEGEARLRGGLGRAVESYKRVRLFSMEDRVERSVSGLLEHFLETAYERLKVGAFFQFLSSTLLSYAEMSVLIGSGFLVLQGEMSVGALFGFMTSYGRVVNSIRGFSDLLPALAKAAAYLDRFEEYTSDLEEAPSAALNSSNHVELTNIDFGYGETVVLSKFNFDVAEGERVLIQGDNGSGKSTLAHVLTGFLTATTGDTRVPGITRASALISDMGFVPGTGLDNIGYDELDAAERASADKLIQAFALGGVMERDPVSFSAGQQRKLEILATLLKPAELYVFDEPLANIDAGSKSEVMKTILRSTKGKRLIVILHGDESLHRFFDRTVTLDDNDPAEPTLLAASGLT